MFEDAITAWRNAGLDSASLNTEALIGEKTTIWGYGGWWPSLKQVGNDFIVKPTSALVAMIPFTTTVAKEPEPMPVIPAALEKGPLAENLAKAYKQKCDAVIEGAEAAKCAANFDFNGYKSHTSVAAHNKGLVDISLPEGLRSSSVADTGIGAAIGGLVASIPEGVKADIGNKIIGKATSLLT